MQVVTAGESAGPTSMPEKRWFWATLTLSSITIVSVVLAAGNWSKNRLFRDANYVTLHYLYVTRGIASSLLLAFWAAWFVLRQRRKSEADLRRSRDLYRGLLEAFPGAVMLYDSELRVLEWNAPAERMYGYTQRGNSAARRLPIRPRHTPPSSKTFLRRVRARRPRARCRDSAPAQRMASPSKSNSACCPFAKAPAPSCFLEVTTDIRERVRWRRAT